MIIPKKSLSGEDIRQAVEEVLSKHLGLSGAGYKCEGSLVINVLVAAAIEARTLESVCEDLAMGLAVMQYEAT